MHHVFTETVVLYFLQLQFGSRYLFSTIKQMLTAEVKRSGAA